MENGLLTNMINFQNLQFTKMSGSGNDFIIINNQNKIIPDTDIKYFTENICKRAISVGADGILLIENSNNADFKMRIINSDGSEVEMCGNGARCAVRYAVDNAIVDKPDTTFETLAGQLKGYVNNDIVKVQLTNAHSKKINEHIKLKDNVEFNYSFLNTGVPHVVILFDDTDKVDVQKLGAQIRYHDNFKPAGTNANFITVLDENNIKIRTYERGVESETLACGTGCAASAILAGQLGKVKPPVKMHTRSGEIITIDWKINGQEIIPFLEGKVRYIYKGFLSEEAM